MTLAHLRTLIWLRSRLSWNRFTRGKTWVGVVAMILRALLVLAAAALAVGGFLAGLHLLADAGRLVLWGVWVGMTVLFLFTWMISILAEVQQAESIDVRRLMHLPISLRQVFLINYLASLFSPSLILAVPATGALALGLVLSRGPQFLWLYAVLFAFFFSLTAWTYCLRGWLVNLMTNKRKRRAIIMGMTAAVVLAGQIPNVVIHSPWVRDGIAHLDAGPDDPAGAPPALLRVLTGVADLPLRSIAVPFFLGGLLVGGWGLHHAYRVTVGFYTARGSRRRASPRIRRGRSRTDRRILVQRRIPLVSEPVSALALAQLRSGLRAPEIRMSLIMPLVLSLVFGLIFLDRAGSHPLPPAFNPLPALGAVAFSTFGTSQFVFNAFGMDRDGFRLLLLLPVSGRQVLLAKNLALSPFSIGIGGILLLVVGLAFRLDPGTLVAATLQLLAIYLLLCILGNLASVWVPFRQAGASMRKSSVPPQTVLMVFLFQLCIPLAMIPVAIPPALSVLVNSFHPWAGALVNLGGSACILAIAWFGYAGCLGPAGRYLESRRLIILQTVTSEPE